MDRETAGWMLVAAGAVVLGFSALADVIGIADDGFGWKQFLGVTFGVVAIIGGLALVYLRRREVSAGRRLIETVGTSTAGSAGTAPTSTEQQDDPHA